MRDVSGFVRRADATPKLREPGDLQIGKSIGRGYSPDDFEGIALL